MEVAVVIGLALKSVTFDYLYRTRGVGGGVTTVGTMEGTGILETMGTGTTGGTGFMDTVETGGIYRVGTIMFYVFSGETNTLSVSLAVPVYDIFFLKQQHLQHQQSSNPSKVSNSKPPIILGMRMAAKFGPLSRVSVLVLVATGAVAFPLITVWLAIGNGLISEEITPKGPNTLVELILVTIFLFKSANAIPGSLSTTPLTLSNRLTGS